MSGLPALSDLPYLYCWICAEEEKHNVFARPIQLNADPPSTSRFIHPCVCSLVAHEKYSVSFRGFGSVAETIPMRQLRAHNAKQNAGVALDTEGVPRMIIVGEDNQGAELVDGAFGTLDTLDTYETLDDGSRVPLIGSGDQGVYLDELEYGTFDDVDMPRTIYVTYYSLAKLVVQALGFPFIASFAGSILGRFARYSQALRQILGIAPGIIPERGCESWINVLWPSVQSTHAVEQYLVDNGAAVYDDLDPIWFRNAIGGGLYIVIKDALVLLYRYLRKQRRGQLHIKDLPFSDGVARELMQNAEPRPAAR
ncbi:hypothetical protein MVES1_000243 [Malassezia vespertilionis]|uniref:uncharacterized protein n=1 Tax=Malassezia vespertilionis TaxID=2020962 RepID=UPI0024B1A909|nr:uncharacterized protein MVES1_000243 [Malassezia vespertilionis]WFD04918.1 hypothetical protein MVES1_000243 [Malassezia vespertilionis]